MLTRADKRMKNLAYANRVRSDRADLRLRVRAGTMTLAEIILTCPPCLVSAEIGRVVAWQPRWGRVRVSKFFNRLHPLRPSRTVGSLTARERALIVDQLP